LIRQYFFDTDRAFDYTKTLAFPRQVGTRQERRAARIIHRAFAALGLPCERERFSVSFFQTEILSRLVLVVAGLLMLAGASLAAEHPVIAAGCWGAAGFLINSPWRLGRLVQNHWPPCSVSENLVATLPEPPDAAPARVIFMAHYDTKSQLVPTGVRVALVSTATVLCGFLAVRGLVAACGWPMVPATAFGLAVAVVVMLVGLIANVSGNRSPGVLDNGCSVGVLLELANSWRPKTDAPVEVVWVATGSEEVGLDGARHFLEQHHSWWKEKPTLLINLESVGAGASVYLAGEARALRLAQETAAALELPHARLRVLGAAMDHEPFAARQLPSGSILGDVVRHSLSLHTRRDDLPLIELPALERAGQLAAHLAWNWAEQHQPARTGKTEVRRVFVDDVEDMHPTTDPDLAGS